jgi:hypothetical protein
MAWTPDGQQEGGGRGSGDGGGGGGGGGGGPQWGKEPAARCPVGASVVACAIELQGDGGALKEVGLLY